MISTSAFDFYLRRRRWTSKPGYVFMKPWGWKAEHVIRTLKGFNGRKRKYAFPTSVINHSLNERRNVSDNESRKVFLQFRNASLTPDLNRGKLGYFCVFLKNWWEEGVRKRIWSALNFTGLVQFVFQVHS